MAYIFFVVAAICATVSAAPPSQPGLHHAPAHLQLNPLDYYSNNPEIANFYQAQQKEGNSQATSNGAPARLENLEPDSEVELLPGAQQPQQPPQQNPVAPNIPGLVPGQRVFIVHMPVAGYRPGTIGGYQPVYIVGAAPQGNAGFPTNGYQNAILVDPSSGQVVSPVVGYQRPGVGGAVQGINPLFFGGAPLTLNRPFGLGYQNPAYFQGGPQGFQGFQGPQGLQGLQGGQGVQGQGAISLSQLAALQNQPETGNTPRNVGNAAVTTSESKRVDESASIESNSADEPRRNIRPAQSRKPS